MRNRFIGAVLLSGLFVSAPAALSAGPGVPSGPRPEVKAPSSEPFLLDLGRWLAERARRIVEPPFDRPRPKPVQTNDDPTVCPVPLERGNCPVG